ncbi:metal-dependent hydrolase family protein [Aquicella lusitana]|uniref:Imidazolonepropionase-like amidohydrolase n=1 Tax=Aquicella lusitana TaxID=254246 RepID=A0A370GYX5_9COXI|nr:amidohydrolase family protein [Aquicella lusitana]RDI48868.1 imidazolonepropionase-like amidohydrolase [Aquicella lusitana]VVC73296.1 Imidazolonepropionase [Aquicella lusitana]
MNIKKTQIKSAFKTFIFLALVFSTTQAISATIYLQAKQYLDIKTGKLIKPANLLIDGKKIVAINPANVPATAIIIKKSNLTLLPGLMDMHVHLPNDFNQQFKLQLVQDDDAMSTVRGVKNARILLMAGFTTVRNLGLTPGEGFVDVALAKASEAGWIVAPHIIPAGHGLSITGGHMDPDMFGPYAPNVLPVSYRTGIADGVDEVIKSVRYQIKHGAKVIKAAATAGVLSEEDGVGNQQYSYEELKAMVDEAGRHDIPVAVHAHGTEGINAAVKAGVRSIEHGSLLDDESIRLMKQHGTFLIPTTYVTDAINLDILSPITRKKAEYLMPIAKKNLQKAIKSGVKIAFGTDSPVIPHGENAKEFAALVRRGMQPIDAIRTATINAADLLRLQDRGQIRVGYHADIIGVLENPLTNIHALEHVHFVMKDGEVFKG